MTAAARQDDPESWLQTKLRNYYAHPRGRDVAALRSAVQTGTLPAEQAAFDQRLLDVAFWELTYWQTPELYDELTAGERLHPGIFRQLGPLLRGRTVLDAGAGSGRATIECLRQRAGHVWSVEPSPGLRRLLRRKLAAAGPDGARVTVLAGRFEALSLPANSVDVALACSAFTARPGQGGDAGLAELRRVTRPSGRIVVIWPRPEDYAWLAARGFVYVALPAKDAPRVRFASLERALRVAEHFYADNPAVRRYLLQQGQPEIPYELLGHNPPHDYCWLAVQK
jgi:ubiquinone/menaquinone biosynthesis C-methylase UbiE